MLDCLPLNIIARQVAENTAMRLNATETRTLWNWTNAKHLGDFNMQMPVDYITSEHIFDPGFIPIMTVEYNYKLRFCLSS